LWLSFSYGLLGAGASRQNRGLPDFTELVEKQGPAVVNISTTQSVRSNGRGAQPFPFDENDPMYEFFRRFIPRQPGMPGIPGVPRDFESRSLGSGFVVISRRLSADQCTRRWIG
jgi:serine protease Do